MIDPIAPREPSALARDVLPFLERYAPAPPEALDARELLQRTDTKFLVPAARLGDLLAELANDYQLLLAGGRAVASYRTLYFDTPELRCFHDHRRGRRARHKVRIRHYPDRELSYLEVKTKHADDVTRKQRARRPYGDNLLAREDRELIASCTDLGEELAPEIWVDFHRLTLLATATRERVTIDLDVEMSRHDQRETLRGVAIVEVKQERFRPCTPVMRVANRDGVRQESASKYCTGVALLRSGLRVNRLLPALRAIERMRT